MSLQQCNLQHIKDQKLSNCSSSTRVGIRGFLLPTVCPNQPQQRSSVLSSSCPRCVPSLTFPLSPASLTLAQHETEQMQAGFQPGWNVTTCKTRMPAWKGTANIHKAV